MLELILIGRLRGFMLLSNADIAEDIGHGEGEAARQEREQPGDHRVPRASPSLAAAGNRRAGAAGAPTPPPFF
eukprot:scaffold200472_cov32-Tisochrysis_lutea.AAC.4